MVDRLFVMMKGRTASVVLPAAALLAGLVVPGVARAQMPQGPGPTGSMGGEEEQKPEGAAEKAPEGAGELPSTPHLPPYPGEKQKAFELVQLDGYLRLRTDWKSNYHLGFHDDGAAGAQGTPFPEPLSCLAGTSANASTCTETIGSADMRLRLEPKIHLSEKVSLHMQVDVLDNLVLGSTNEAGVSADTPLGAFGDSQNPPQAGGNSTFDSIRVKRAWAEVVTPLGLVKFGRMPTQWGLGLRDNAGGFDPLHDSYCTDCDSGDTVDRVIFSLGIPGTGLTGAIGMDWANSGPTSGRLYGERAEYQEFDLDNADDSRQWVFVVSDLHDGEERKERLDLGQTVLDWGVMLTYRRQDWEVRDNGAAVDPPPLTEQLNLRKAYMYIPDAYFRLSTGSLTFEVEAVAVLGGIDNIADVDTDPATDGVQGVSGSQDIVSFGGVGRLHYKLSDDELDLGFEVGYASGDDWEAAKAGEVHTSKVPVLPASPAQDDGTISAFLFDENYHVDLILFRELLGTVRNATYVKPSLTYELTPRLRFSAAGILSFANSSVATPGNSSLWGLEMDGDLGYHNDREGFFAGISYGVLFPLAAMDHPSNTFMRDEDQGNASTAQTIQMRLMLKF